jgi:hypothetical protein
MGAHFFMCAAAGHIDPQALFDILNALYEVSRAYDKMIDSGLHISPDNTNFIGMFKRHE